MDTINEILSWILLFVLLWNGYILLFNRGVPNIRTAPAIRKKLIEILKKDREERGIKEYTIIDLGSGTGRLTRDIARAMPDAKVVGLEISKPAYIHSEIGKKLCRLDNLSYVRGDFFEYDLSKADAVVFYLTLYEMGRVADKLYDNLRPGTLVTSNRFKLKLGWEPIEEHMVGTAYLHQKQFYVYRKKDVSEEHREKLLS